MSNFKEKIFNNFEMLILKSNEAVKSNFNADTLLQYINSIDLILKELKNDHKSLKSNLKIINSELSSYSKYLSINDFNELVNIEMNDTFSEISVKLLANFSFNEARDKIYNLYLSKFLPINSMTNEDIKLEFNDLSKYPDISDIYNKLPSSYKPKKIPKNREKAIDEIILKVINLKSKYISESINKNA